MIQKLGKYTIVEKLGEGAMGAVYKAYDEILDRYVAVKTMAEDIKWDPELKLRFYREARSAASLHHPNIVTIHDMGEDGKITYIVMELLQGEDLKSAIKRQAPFSLEKRLSIMAQVADGLSHAHMNGIIHRDVKPGNIHVSPSGNVKIVDFGIARIPSSDLTRSGARLGTPIYMSPEQIRGGEYDERSDIFSSGIVFYELLTYQHPFRDKNIAKTLDNILFQSRFPFAEQFPDAPPGLWEIVQTSLAKEVDQRYGSMAELAKACREFLVELNLSAQRMQKQLQSSLPRLRQTVTEGRAAPRLAQLFQQAESLLKQEEKPDFLSLRRIVSSLSEDPAAQEAAYATAPRAATGDIPAAAGPAAAAAVEQRGGMAEEAAKSPPLRAQVPPPQAPQPNAADELHGKELLQAGRSLLKESRLDEALDQLRQSMALLGPREEVVQALIETRRLIEERKSAQSTQMLASVREALAAKEYQKALDSLTEILASQPDSAEALELRRKIMAEMEAEKERQERRDEGEREKAAGLRLVAEQKYREGRQALQRARELLGDDVELRDALDKAVEAVRVEELQDRIKSELSRAAELAASGNYEKARRHLRFLLDLSPDHPEALRALARIDAEEAEKRRAADIAQKLSQGRDSLRNQNFDAASLFAHEVLQLDPVNIQAQELVRETETSREAKRRSDEIRALLSQSQEALRQQDFDIADARAHNVLALDSGNTEALELLRRTETARQTKLRQEEINSLLARGREALSHEDFAAGRSCTTKALELDAGHPGAAELLRRLNSAEEQKRKHDEVASLLAQGQQAFLREDLEESERCARRVLELEAGHEKASDLLARAGSFREKRRREQIDRYIARTRDALQKGNYDQARACARELCELEPENDEARQLTSEVGRAEEQDRREKISALLDKGRQALAAQDFEEAARFGDQASSLDPTNKPAKALIREIEKERRKQEKLRVKEEKRRQKERPVAEAVSDPEATALLEKTVFLKDSKGGGFPKWAMWSLLGLFVTALAAGGGYYWWHRPSPPADDFSQELAQARSDLGERRFDQALETLRRILARHPENSEVAALIASTEGLQNQAAIDSLLIEAQSLKAQGRYDESLQSIEKILRIDPSSEAARAVQAEVQQLMQPTPTPRDPAAMVGAWAANARSLLAADKLPEAKVEIDRIARAAPAAPQLAELRKLYVARSADLGRRQREAAESAESQGRLEKLKKQAGDAFRNGKYVEAQAALDQWLGLAPQDNAGQALRQQTAQALQALHAYEAAMGQKRYDEALRALAQIEKMNPSDPAMNELRKRAEGQRASARATLSIFRLGPAATLLLDDQPVGRDGEVNNFSIPVGSHKITVRNAQGRQFEKTTEFFEGQTVPFVYEATGPALREMQDADRELLNNRRNREEIHRYDVEHDHAFGGCRGTLSISGIAVSYAGSEKSHSFNLPFQSLQLELKDNNRKVELSTKDRKRNWGFKVKDASLGLQIKALWEKLAQAAR